MSSNSGATTSSVQSVVFTDLDATLLDHHHYSWQPAAHALAALAARDIPVCIVTSKTVAEVKALRAQLGNAHPFAVENGGAVAVPRGYFAAQPVTPDTPVELTTLGADYDTLRSLAVTLRNAHGYRFQGFGDMDVGDVRAATGLDAAAAAQAMDRQASEPLLWQDSDEALADFSARVRRAGYTTREGGRFVHVLGHAHKGDALNWLRSRFMGACGAILAVALGDSGNDADMLDAADIGYWVARSDGTYYRPADGSIRHAEGIGPNGWARAIETLIAGGEI